MTTFIWGMVAGVVVSSSVLEWIGPTRLYRRWYLMVRNELEKLDPTNDALRKIGARTSKKEPWE